MIIASLSVVKLEDITKHSNLQLTLLHCKGKGQELDSLAKIMYSGTEDGREIQVQGRGHGV